MIKRHITKFPITLYVLYILFALSAPLFANTITANDIYLLTNKERDVAKIETLSRNPLLEEAAKSKAQAIFDKQLFAHNFEDTQFYQFADEANYHYVSLGENLAIDYFNPESVVKGWLASPKHRANLLNRNFKEIGVAVAQGEINGITTIVVVQLFGTPKDSLVYQQPEYYDQISELTNKNISLAGFIIGAATIEAGTILSYIYVKLKNRKRRF